MALYLKLNTRVKDGDGDQAIAEELNRIMKLGVSERIYLLEQEIGKYQKKSIDMVAGMDSLQITSESELSSEQKTNRSKKAKLSNQPDIISLGKHYTPTGMTALFAPLIAYHLSKDDPDNEKSAPIRVKRENYTYFEATGWSDKKIDSKYIVFTDTDDSYNDVDVVYVDNNPCVTEATPPITVEEVIEKIKNQNAKVQMLVVDITSATQEQIKDIKMLWKDSGIPFLCLASSGLKHRQAGFDMAQYGENYLFFNKTANPKLETLANDLKHRMRQSTKASSSVYATHVRRTMRTTVAEHMPTLLELSDKISKQHHDEGRVNKATNKNLGQSSTSGSNRGPNPLKN